MSFKRARLKSIRTKQHLAQDRLALKVGVSQSKLSQWERGIRKPEPSEIADLARVLGVSVEELTGVRASDPAGEAA